METKSIVMLVKTVLGVLAIAGLLSLGLGWVAKVWWMLLLGIICLGISISFFLKGLKIVQKPEVWITEVFGKYHPPPLEPGLHWLCPYLQKVRAIIPGWIRPVELFVEEPQIDFKEGGTAVLVEPTVWIRVLDAEKAIYEVANWKTAVRELVETCLRSYLGSLTVENVITKVYKEKISWWELLRQRYPVLEESFKDWGIEGQRITITDFRWGDEVVSRRQEVFKASRQIEISRLGVEAAKFEADREAFKIGGVIGRIKKTLVEELGYTKKRAEELAPKVFNFAKAADTGSLFLTRLDQEEMIGPLVAEIVTLVEKTREKVKEKTD